MQAELRIQLVRESADESLTLDDPTASLPVRYQGGRAKSLAFLVRAPDITGAYRIGYFAVDGREALASDYFFVHEQAGA